jgi:hypothetical protein
MRREPVLGEPLQKDVRGPATIRSSLVSRGTHSKSSIITHVANLMHSSQALLVVFDALYNISMRRSS